MRAQAEDNIQVTRSISRFFFSSPLTGPWKNAFKTECMRVWSPGARVGHAWLNVFLMKGKPEDESSAGPAGGSGTARGKLGFAVAEVGRGGSEMMSGVMPGNRIATTFCTDLGF